MKGLKWRGWVVGFSVVFAVYLLIPSFLKFRYGKVIPKIAKADDPWYTHWLPSETLKLGLDLMGGLHLVLGIDFNEVQKDAVTKLKNQLKERLETDKVENIQLEVTAANRLVATAPNAAALKSLDATIGKYLGEYVDPEGSTETTTTLKISTMYDAEVRRRAIDQSIETLRNRIDEFGIAEPILQRHGEDKILLQFPGVQDPGRLKDIVARTAKLSFQIVRSGPEEPGGGNGAPTETELQRWVTEFQTAKNIRPDIKTPMPVYLKQINAFYADKLPKGNEIIFHRKVNVNTKESEYIPYVLEREALVTGEDLQDASTSFNQETNDPIVNFQLTPAGATKFEKATGENVHKYMAIVLDGNVNSAPRIKQKIGGGRAMIEMGGNGRSPEQIQNEAKDTSLVLRSGALPARLEFLEERVVGPSLGADAIRSGVLSLIAGLSAVFIFIGIYYRWSGMVANMALFLNGLFVLACMAAFEGTLTLPGLAGLVLTLGMAVDANVLIFEHIRECLRTGKGVAMSVAEGYERAFSAILDGNLTSIIAGIVLLSFGYGPIRGFAVTLLIGLTASLYTAVFVTRFVFDSFIHKRNLQTLSV